VVVFLVWEVLVELGVDEWGDVDFVDE